MPDFEVRSWGDLFSYYVDVCGLHPEIVLEFDLEEVKHISLNKSAYKAWENHVQELASEHARKKRR